MKHRLCAFLSPSRWPFLARPARVQDSVELFRDDFSRFPPGLLSAPLGQLNGAIQEYHYIEHRGVRTHPWRNPIVHLDSWAAGDEGDKPYLEQHLINEDLRFAPLFVTGDAEWRDYRVEVLGAAALAAAGGGARVPLSHLAALLPARARGRQAAPARAAAADRSGIPRQRLAGTGGRAIRLRHEDLVSPRGQGRGRSAAGIRRRQAADRRPRSGADGGHRRHHGEHAGPFQGFRVTATAPAAAELRKRIDARERELEQLRAGNPRPQLWRQFETKGYGTGRNVRFGDLDGDGRLDMLFAQQVAEGPRRRLRSDQLPDRGHARGQGAVAAGQTESEERSPDQRHAVSDSRSRRRWPHRSRARARFPAPGARRPDRHASCDPRGCRRCRRRSRSGRTS